MLQRAPDESVLERIPVLSRAFYPPLDEVNKFRLGPAHCHALALPYARHPHSKWRTPSLIGALRRCGLDLI